MWASSVDNYMLPLNIEHVNKKLNLKLSKNDAMGKVGVG